jgi:hypothetical protein
VSEGCVRLRKQRGYVRVGGGGCYDGEREVFLYVKSALLCMGTRVCVRGGVDGYVRVGGSWVYVRECGEGNVKMKRYVGRRGSWMFERVTDVKLVWLRLKSQSELMPIHQMARVI